MAATMYLETADSRLQGAAIDKGDRPRVVLSAVAAAQLSGALVYDLPVD